MTCPLVAYSLFYYRAKGRWTAFSILDLVVFPNIFLDMAVGTVGLYILMSFSEALFFHITFGLHPTEAAP